MPITETGTETGTGSRSGAKGWAAAQNAAAADRARRKYSLGAVKDWVALAVAEIAPRFGITTVGGFGQRSNPTDHDDGLATDFMVSSDRGTALANYAIANRRRLSVKYVIWRQHIYDGRTHWKPELMEDRGSPTANHMDHVHVSYYDHPGAGGQPIPAHHAPMGGGAAAGDLQGTLYKVALAGLFVVAGAGLVVVGLAQASAPARKAAQSAAMDTATKAASLAGPEGKAAATAMKAGGGPPGLGKAGK